MPQLLPDGLGPSDHLTVAKATAHPCARPPTLPVCVDQALSYQLIGHDKVAQFRSDGGALFVTLAGLCAEQNARIVDAVHPRITAVVACRNVAFIARNQLCLWHPGPRHIY